MIERTLLRHLYKLDHALRPAADLRPGADRSRACSARSYGVSGQPYPVPELLQGATNLGFMVLPNYRAWVVVASLVVCLGTWFVIERTRLGAYLRAGTENPKLVRGLRHQRAADGDADLRLRRRPGGASPACWPRR